jgi:hypothetical protein
VRIEADIGNEAGKWARGTAGDDAWDMGIIFQVWKHEEKQVGDECDAWGGIIKWGLWKA